MEVVALFVPLFNGRPKIAQKLAAQCAMLDAAIEQQLLKTNH
jgi:hypothetical protein